MISEDYLYDHIFQAYYDNRGSLFDVEAQENVYGFTEEQIKDFWEGNIPIPDQELILTLKEYARYFISRYSKTKSIPPTKIVEMAESHFQMPTDKWNSKAWMMFVIELSLPNQASRLIFLDDNESHKTD